MFASSWGKARGSRALPMAEWGYLPAGRVSTADPRSREVIRNACKAVGSISSTAFDVRFNPDIFSPGRCWGRAGSAPQGHLGATQLCAGICLATRPRLLLPSSTLCCPSHRGSLPRVLPGGSSGPEAAAERCRCLPALLPDPRLGEGGATRWGAVTGLETSSISDSRGLWDLHRSDFLALLTFKAGGAECSTPLCRGGLPSDPERPREALGVGSALPCPPCGLVAGDLVL